MRTFVKVLALVIAAFILSMLFASVAAKKDGDFIVGAPLKIPYTLQQSSAARNTTAIILYNKGMNIDIHLTQTTGLPILDKLITLHIQQNYKVKAGRSGSAKLPVVIRL